MAAPATALAVSVNLICTFDPPVDVINQAGIEYAVEARRSDGLWVEVARGPGSPNIGSGMTGSLLITFNDNVPFGVYAVRVVVIKPIRGPESEIATTDIVPGKPMNPKINATRPPTSNTTTANPR
jgi:hypothetical protein